MYRSSQPAPERILARPGFFWVMYDMNQYLYFAKEEAHSRFPDIHNSAALNKVLRNTENVFKQSSKYFTSLMSNYSPIRSGNKVTGLPIEWDDSFSAIVWRRRKVKKVPRRRKMKMKKKVPSWLSIGYRNFKKKKSVQRTSAFLWKTKKKRNCFEIKLVTSEGRAKLVMT